MRSITLITCLFLLVAVAPLAAQDSTPAAGWPVETRCVGDPIPPPGGWTWDGTIFVQGNQGIRDLNDYYQTPYFALFHNAFIYGAALSPDGRWYAVPIGEQRYATMIDYNFVVMGIKVISTDTSRKEYFVPWNFYNRASWAAYAVPKLVWTDNEHLVYPYANAPKPYLVNPFTGEKEEWKGELSPSDALVSPDGSRALQIIRNTNATDAPLLLVNYPDVSRLPK
jgi:hypothetical protein